MDLRDGELVHQLTVAQIHTLDCGHLLKEFPDAEVVRGNKIATLPEVFAVADSHRADAPVSSGSTLVSML
ncbi:hypothetical protein MAHJHV28_46120 [Mycobacterium avium subsp. hominissuis]